MLKLRLHPFNIFHVFVWNCITVFTICHNHLEGKNIASHMLPDSFLEAFYSVVHSNHESILSSQGYHDPSWPILKEALARRLAQRSVLISAEWAQADGTLYLFQTSLPYWPPYQNANEGCWRGARWVFKLQKHEDIIRTKLWWECGYAGKGWKLQRRFTNLFVITK